MKNKINRKFLGVIILLGFLFLLVTPVLAADGIVPCGHDKACTLCDLIAGFKKLFDYGIKIIAVITLACATFAGVMYIVSSGNEGTMESAKKFLSASLIGFAVVLGAWVMVNTTIKVLMPTKSDLGIGKSWVDFGSVDCLSSTPSPSCSNSCSATSQPNCQASGPANSETGSGTCCEGACYKCKTGFSWNGSACSLPVPVITTASLSDGRVEVSYTATLSASGGDGTYTWLVTGLPAGLSQTNNIISGIPTADGTFKVNIKLTSGTQNVSKQLNLIINAKPKCELLAGSKSADFVFVLMRTQCGVPSEIGDSQAGCNNWKIGNTSEFSQFSDKANRMAKGLDEIPSADKNYFAVYRMDEIYNGSNSSKLQDIFSKDCPEASRNKLFSYGYIYNDNLRAYAGVLSTGNAYYGLAGSAIHDIKVFAHEQIGHIFAKFRDEYDSVGNSAFWDVVSGKSWGKYDLPWANVTRDNKCAKWQSLATGCFQGCDYTTTRCYRASDNSIMRDTYEASGFNAVQKYIITACVKVFSNCPPKSLKETVIF